MIRRVVLSKHDGSKKLALKTLNNNNKKGYEAVTDKNTGQRRLS